MRLKYLKFKNWLLLTLMGALGLSGCRSHKQQADSTDRQIAPSNEIMLLYGVPPTDFQQQ